VHRPYFPALSLFPAARATPGDIQRRILCANPRANPLQRVREDFGTMRFDETFSSKDSFAGVYTVDDSGAHSPSNNPFTVVDIFLREQVASLNETHIFSPSLLNRATFGFSRGGLYFNSGTTVNLPS
jgi:hypothetical protein